MRAIISVSDKTGIVEFAKDLQGLGVEIFSTGGTYKLLKSQGISVLSVSDITEFPECLDGRVKTLHPKIHGGILARRDLGEHMNQLGALDITPIDLVVINLYPFKETISKPRVSLGEAVENIDIGGPAMLRSAGKNYKDVMAVSSPDDYCKVVNALKNSQVTESLKYELALKVFQHTAAYDTLIAQYLGEQVEGGSIPLPDQITFTYEKIQDLRYGENPHQKAAYYKDVRAGRGALTNARQLHGKELSFNNINDTNAAVALIKEFDKATVVAVKHANPCGVASADSLKQAYVKAHSCDPVSIFGGIVACNRQVDRDTALEMSKIFLEIVIAPSFSQEAQEILCKKPNIRLLELGEISRENSQSELDIKKISGGLLLQSLDNQLVDVEKKVSKREPCQKEIEDMEMAMKVVKHTKSNAIVFVKDSMSIAIAPGQTNRIWAVQNAIKQSLFSLEGAVMASDAFFPFDDCVEAAGKAGISAIIQPGGSIKDEESIAKADQMKIAMIFTGLRHFKH